MGATRGVKHDTPELSTKHLEQVCGGKSGDHEDGGNRTVRSNDPEAGGNFTLHLR
jgi:hypothetical protein